MRKIIIALLVILSLVFTVSAHSGRTDSSGGHRDNKNKSGLGSYHYHCGGYPAHLHTSGYCPYRDKFPTSVKVSASKTKLGMGEEVALTAKVSPSNACDKDVDWESSNTKVITVRNGVAKAVGYGTATLTAETFNGKKASVKLTVKEIVAEKLAISDAPSSLFVAESATLSYTIYPSNVDNPAIIWSSSNEQVATVSAEGTVSALNAGSTTIKATTSNGITASFALVVQNREVETVAIEASSLSLVLQETANLSVKVLPETATFPEVAWSSSNEDVLTVSKDGKITAYSCGFATVTATASNGISGSVEIEVTEIMAQQIEIKRQNSGSIQVGSEEQLAILFYPENVTNKDVMWSVSNPEIATIDETGKLVALAAGKVTVTATHKDNSTTLLLQVSQPSSDEGSTLGSFILAGWGIGIILLIGLIISCCKPKRHSHKP